MIVNRPAHSAQPWPAAALGKPHPEPTEPAPPAETAELSRPDASTRQKTAAQPTGLALSAPPLPGSLAHFLIDAPQNARVRDLVEAGWTKYGDPNHSLTIARAQAKQANQMGAGRSQAWVEETLGKDEKTLVAELGQEAPPATWSLEEINTAFAAITGQHPPDESLGGPRIISVKGMGVNYLSDHSSRVEGGFCQLASQFNYLESPGPFTVPVTDYLNDRTQGPQGAIETAAGALHRHAAVSNGSLPHALADVLPEQNQSDYYRDGYLEIFRLEPAELKTVHEQLKQSLPKFRILAQPVTAEATHASFFQVLSAAPSWQGQSPPRADSVEAQMAALLVVSQYEAIAKLAVMKSLLTRQETPVHLTLVGQGVFNNPPEIMTEALRRVAGIVKGYPDVQVYVQSYSSHEPVRRANQDGLFQHVEMDRATFESVS
jgi:hypothetical protein